MKIACENPQLIFAPNLKWLVSTKCRVANFNGRIVKFVRNHIYYNFPWFDFYVAKEEVTPDNVDNFVVVDDDGVTYPAFMYVPCGHCRLCRKHYVDDWCTRCMCESADSDFPPLFVTLTYRPEDRPDTADECKRDFQLFMKRLRARVARDLGQKDCELRYFARSERTPTNKYWHVHFLLWNMPYVSCREGDRNSFQSLIRFIQEDCWTHGITRVERCRDVSGCYVMKYAQKEDKDEYWQLASRRNGIGNKFAMRLLPLVLANPDMMSFKVSNGSSVVTRSIPAYFKRIWFPTLSVLFPAIVCKAANDFMDCATRLHYFMSFLPEGSQSDLIAEMVADVSAKYRIMHIDFDDACPHRNFIREVNEYIHTRDSVGSLIPCDERCISKCRVPVVHDGLLYPELRDVVHSVGPDRDNLFPYRPSRASTSSVWAYNFRYSMITSWSLLKRSYAILMDYQFDEAEFIRRLSITASHQEFVRAAVDQMPDVDVSALLNQCEIDDNWVASHWMQKEVG